MNCLECQQRVNEKMGKSYRRNNSSEPKRLLAYYKKMEESLVCSKCQEPLKVGGKTWHFNGYRFEHRCADGTISPALPKREKPF